MDKFDVTIRNADINDGDILYAWANDMEVRMNSFSREDFTYDDHLRWYKEKLKNENSHIFIATKPSWEDDFHDQDLVDDMLSKDAVTKAVMADALGAPGDEAISRLKLRREIPIGQIRLDIEADGTAIIDYSVDHKYRGQGYGKELLSLVLGIRDERIKRFVGLVKPKNIASVKAFLGAGFVHTGDGEKNNMPYGIYTLERSPSDNKEGADSKGASGTGGKTGKCILICTAKTWNIRNAQIFANRYARIHDTFVITDEKGLDMQVLKEINPDVIFFPHWSFWIPAEVYENYECIAFHMSDLPFGRGGSPLQNLIVRGYKDTVISALRVEKEFDAGPIYMKEPLSLEGTADDILKRASDIIFNRMIPVLLRGSITPKPQEGEAVVFERRTPLQGRLTPDMNGEKVYDYIRMLDGEGYPPAFMDFSDSYVMEFSQGSYDKAEDVVTARVVIRKKS